MSRLMKIAGTAAALIAGASVGAAAVEGLQNTDPNATFYDRFGKRASDFAVGLVALPVVGAVTAACGVAIVAEDNGPVFVTKNGYGRLIVMDIEYYERTMQSMEEARMINRGIDDYEHGKTSDGKSTLKKLRDKYGI